MYVTNIHRNQFPNIKVPKEVLNETSTFMAVEFRFCSTDYSLEYHIYDADLQTIPHICLRCTFNI